MSIISLPKSNNNQNSLNIVTGAFSKIYYDYKDKNVLFLKFQKQ